MLRSEGGVYRLLDERATSDWRAFAASELCRRASADGRLVPTRELDAVPEDLLSADAAGDWVCALEHEPTPFVSYPYEWSFGMLRDAALLQLELLDEALEEGLTLKDASPYNVQWRGAAPQFIDIGSYVRWRRGEVWIGYRQFCQLFLFPLMLRAYKDVPFQPWLRGDLAGISPADFTALTSWRDRLRPGVLVHGWLQAKMLRRFERSASDVGGEIRRQGFDKAMIQANVRRLRRLVEGLAWKRGRSEWAEYDQECSYDDEDRRAKEAFVEGALAGRRWRSVWDLGCNTGRFSELAAEHAELVLAIDGDELSIERLYQRRRGAPGILPLVVDLAQPSPALGWRGRERAPLALRGRPELVLCLALVHHLAIGASIPLEEIVGWLAELGGRLVVELPHRDDPMVERLLRPKTEPHDAYRRERFEQILAARYEIARREPLPGGTRTLYEAVPKG